MMNKCTHQAKLFIAALLVVSLLKSEGKTIDEIFSQMKENRRSGKRQESPGRGENGTEKWTNIEYDIVMTEEQYAKMKNLANSRRMKRKAVKDRNLLWPLAVVPYHIHSTFNSIEGRMIIEAMSEWERHSCLSFRKKRDSDPHWLRFYPYAWQCLSLVGRSRKGGMQDIKLAPDCRIKEIIIHEIGHTIGFYHEHTRPDRDTFIKINERNIRNDEAKVEFEKWINSVDTYGVPYDYKSIMHYGPYYFSVGKNIGQETIETLDPDYQNVIGKAEGLSFYDIKLVNIMYNCSNHCSAPPRCPPDGFVGHDCSCWCPGNPKKNCDSLWLSWGEWGACSVSCGSGVRFRSRECQMIDNYPCEGPSAESKQCHLGPCKTDIGNCTCCGTFTEISGTITSPNFPDPYPEYSNCSWLIKVPTGPIILSFTQFNTEFCFDKLEIYSNPTASTDSLIIELCGNKSNLQPIRTGTNIMMVKFTSDHDVQRQGFHATYKVIRATPSLSAWSPWGACSATCGPGVQPRRRTCPSPADDCPGHKQETRRCQIQTCAIWGGWENWSPCSVTCSHGIQRRTRRCLGVNCEGSGSQERSCSNTQDCPGIFAPWGPWIACSVTCGEGRQTRTRGCQGVNCEGSGSQGRSCNTQICPARFSPWSPWNPCSVTCGPGVQTRTRTCPSPANDCTGHTQETKRCQDQVCDIPGIWLSWEYWSRCSATCNKGTQTRTRRCYPGKCDGKGINVRTCNTQPCPPPDCDTRLGSSSGAISSPNYPSDYPDSKTCTWSIVVPSGRISLTFHKFELENCNSGNTSIYDYLNIYDGLSNQSPRLAHLCGTIQTYQMKPVTSTSNMMMLQFVSDAFEHAKGFSATYTTLPVVAHCLWSTWSACSVTCGRGIQRRSRGGILGQTCQPPFVTIMSCVQPSCNVVLLSCDFETECRELVGVDNLNAFIWLKHSGGTLTGDTGPSGDHSTGQGYYMYTEASGYKREHDTAHLKTRQSLRNNGHIACLEFWYHMYGEGMGSLQVLFIPDGSSSETVLFTRKGDQGDHWRKASTKFATNGNTPFDLVWKASRGADFTSDIAIDDISVTSGTCL